MNNKNIINKIIICILGIISLIIPFTVCLADAGFGSSYGGSYDSSYGGSYGGSYSSSYDSSYGSSYGSSYSGSSSGGKYAISISPIVVIVCGLTLFVILTIISLLPIFTAIPRTSYKDVVMDQILIDKHDPTIKVEEIREYVFDLFVKEQTAWMNFDYKGLRSILSDELYNAYKMQLETLKIENNKNIVKNIKFVEGGVVNIKNNGNNTQTVYYRLHVRMNDYIINTKNDEITYGEENRIMDNTYLITLERTKREEITKCPNCGADITNEASQVCSSCDSVIVKYPLNFVIVKQKVISSRNR